MKFSVRPVDFVIPNHPASHLYLVEDNWDDWFQYQTMYTLYYVDSKNIQHIIGSVKIGQYTNLKDNKRPNLPKDFEDLDTQEYFPIGQDVSYYSNLNSFGDDVRFRILNGLNDMALKPSVYEKAKEEDITVNSLMRNVRHTSIVGQYRSLANGDARLTPYKSSYTGPNFKDYDRTSLSFEVKPKSNPPTNIHVLIGRNAVGKTFMINNMITSLIARNPPKNKVGFFSSDSDDIDREDLFANLVSVSFSAFDPNEPLPERKNNQDGIPYSYIGLKKTKKQNETKALPPKSPENLRFDFAKSLHSIKSSSKTTRWLRSIEMLSADPIFKESDVASILSPISQEEYDLHEEKTEKSKDLIRKLTLRMK